MEVTLVSVYQIKVRIFTKGVPTRVYNPQQPMIILSLNVIGLRFECNLLLHIHLRKVVEGPRDNDAAVSDKLKHFISI